MENLQLMVEMAEALAKTRKSAIDRIDIQYNSIKENYAAYCYISGYKTCYKINENLTIEIIDAQLIYQGTDRTYYKECENKK